MLRETQNVALLQSDRCGCSVSQGINRKPDRNNTPSRASDRLGLYKFSAYCQETVRSWTNAICICIPPFANVLEQRHVVDDCVDWLPSQKSYQVKIQVVDMKIKREDGEYKNYKALDVASKLLQNLSYESGLPHLAISNHVSPGGWMLFYKGKATLFILCGGPREDATGIGSAGVWIVKRRRT
nr:hypothetical protein [Tanacetum cinerariifolium]